MNSALKFYDVIVAGGGTVGAAIAYGLVRQGKKVLVLDGHDTDYRAAKANFGLVWVQGKGYNLPAYQRLSRQTAALWPSFASELNDDTGIELHYENRGGLSFCLGEEEWTQRQARLAAWHEQAPDEPVCARMLERHELESMLPGLELGADVVGASFGDTDGHVNPLALLMALHKGLAQRGSTLKTNCPVTDIKGLAQGGVAVKAGGQRYEAEMLVIAAGLGSTVLGKMVDVDVAIRPQRGQLLVTERLAPLLPFPASALRQTAEGTVMVGLTNEEVGYDVHTTSQAAALMSRRALRILPALTQAKLVRHWACLRIMTPDGGPIYAESPSCPGAWVALCHSGVTLAAFHAGPFSRGLAARQPGPELEFFNHRRFDV